MSPLRTDTGRARQRISGEVDGWRGVHAAVAVRAVILNRDVHDAVHVPIFGHDRAVVAGDHGAMTRNAIGRLRVR